MGISGSELVPLGDGRYEDGDVSEVARMWTTVWDGPISFPDGEVAEALFVDLDELRLRLDRDPFVPDSVALLAARVLGEDR